MRLLIPLQSLLPFECQEYHILIVHKLIFDVSHSINQSEPQSVAIFVKGDSRQCGIERLSIVFDQYGHCFFVTDDMNVKQVFVGIFIDGISDDVVHQLLAAEIDLERCGWFNVAGFQESGNVLKCLLYIFFLIFYREIQRLAIFGLRNQCHHFGIGMLMVDDQCDNEVDSQ